MAVSTFGPWDASIHLQPDQIKRRERAQRADVTPDSVDPVSQSCVIRGSGAAPYQVTLSSCTCSDFVKRNLPCKHIYRLAAELKLIGLPLKHGANKADQLSIEEAVSAIEALSVPAQKYIQRFFGSLSYSSDVTFTCEVTPITEELKTCPLFTYKDTPLPSILGTFTKAQLLDVCAQISVPLTLKKNAAKAALSGWILDMQTSAAMNSPGGSTFPSSPSLWAAPAAPTATCCGNSAMTAFLTPKVSSSICLTGRFCGKMAFIISPTTRSPLCSPITAAIAA